jgi:hypothetical protein
MNRILVSVYVPAAGRAYDVSLPLALRLSQVMPLVARTLTELSDGRYSAGPDAALCDRASGSFLNAECTLWELGLRDGAQLMLI